MHHITPSDPNREVMGKIAIIALLKGLKYASIRFRGQIGGKTVSCTQAQGIEVCMQLEITICQVMGCACRSGRAAWVMAGGGRLT